MCAEIGDQNKKCGVHAILPFTICVSMWYLLVHLWCTRSWSIYCCEYIIIPSIICSWTLECLVSDTCLWLTPSYVSIRHLYTWHVLVSDSNTYWYLTMTTWIIICVDVFGSMSCICYIGFEWLLLAFALNLAWKWQNDGAILLFVGTEWCRVSIGDIATNIVFDISWE